jgi:hypothetical protein
MLNFDTSFAKNCNGALEKWVSREEKHSSPNEISAFFVGVEYITDLWIVRG